MKSAAKLEVRGKVPELLGRILAARGMAAGDIPKFLHPDYGDLGDPWLMTGMLEGVERIVEAVDAGERVVVYGDYDIDGITASAVLLAGLEANGVSATSYIPDRFEEGYGINLAALEKLKHDGAQLVISVDCGITSVAEASWARENGLDLIITDHHAVPEIIPEAVAVINPRQPGDEYPFKDLAGVGVAFALVRALAERTGRPAAGQEKWLLDLVALGTVCDVVPLVGENRVLVSFGLRVMRQARRVGLNALAAVAGVDIGRVTAHHLGFALGPRLNAAGRLETAARSLDLVRTGDASAAGEIAAELDAMNRRRRADQEAIFVEADAQAAEFASDPVLVLADPGWSHGVVGIVASKLVEKWHKPVLVAQVIGEKTKGSARSTGTFNMVEALRDNAGLLEKFGGHFFAAGYTFPTERISELRQGLCDYFRSSGAQAGVQEKAPADIVKADLEVVELALVDELAALEPCGSGNPTATFEFTDLKVADVRVIGQDGRHLKLGLTDRDGKRLEAVGFGLAARHGGLSIGQNVIIRGELNKNEFRGNETVQLICRDISHE